MVSQYVWSNAAGGYVDDLCRIHQFTSFTDVPPFDQYTDYYVMQGPNYDVWGIVDDTGAMAERYEYTPYGQRTVYTSSGTNDPDCYSPLTMSRRITLFAPE